MKRILSHSTRRKAVALFIAIFGFVGLYETRILDSQYEALQGFFFSDQPVPGKRLNFAATAYCKGSTTTSGVVARTGVAAADPQLLPVGSVVNVATGEQKYNGVYTVMDTGPQVRGRELDLYIWSCNEALRFGRKGIEVTVLRLGWDPQASSPSLVDRLFRRREAQRRIPTPEPPPPGGIAPEGQSGDTPATGGGARTEGTVGGQAEPEISIRRPRRASAEGD
jgi:3D (Asp-Asp-Asp) domain-containing protein